MAPAGRRSGPLRGGKKGDIYRIGGIDVPWDPALDLDAPRPTPLQPDSKTFPPKSLSAKEKSEVMHFLAIREKMQKGPLHAVLGDQARISKTGSGGGRAGAATFDAFTGMGGYSTRYAPRKNTLPQLKGRVFVKEFFPRELWATIDPEGHTENGAAKDPSKRKTRKVGELNLLETELDEEKDGEGREKEEEEEVVEEEADEEFQEEDEEGGDYNAEQYFDDGGDDAGDDVDAGEDGGIDYF